MKTLLITALLLMSVSLQSQPADTTKSRSKEKIVYICTGSSAYAYHTDRKCEFLNKCSREIKRVTEPEARQMGRKVCKGCDKKIRLSR